MATRREQHTHLVRRVGRGVVGDRMLRLVEKKQHLRLVVGVVGRLPVHHFSLLLPCCLGHLLSHLQLVLQHERLVLALLLRLLLWGLVRPLAIVLLPPPTSR